MHPDNQSIKILSSVCLFFLTCFQGISPFSVYATNGYITHGYGAKSHSLAGAGSALPLDGMDAASNPATMVYLGDRLDAGVSAFVPSRGFSAHNDSPANGFAELNTGHYDSRNSVFFIPHFARNWMLDSKSSFGVSVGAHGGINTEFDSAVFSAFNNPAGTASSPTGIDVQQLFVGLTYSRKFLKNHSFGITPVIVGQQIKVTGLEPFRAFSDSPDHVSNNGYDYSYGGGVRVGWLSQLSDTFSVGFSYQSRLYMSSFDDYRGLFAEQGDFDIPPNFVAGLSWKMTPKLTFVADVQRILFEEIAAISNRSDLLCSPGAVILGTDDGLGFGWENISVGKFGLQWQYKPDLTLRAGYSISNQVIPEDQVLFNIVAPAAVREHYTFGLTKVIDNVEINLAFMYAPQRNIKGTNPNTGSETISLEMSQYEMEISFGFRF
ncbi:MAG: outer membrane protein transport protein [Desulfobulbaceae bacterium]|nr:outer membrane protein transport protein [Desulfobulbaceae bacterium]